MADKKSSPSSTRQQAERISEAWRNIGETERYGDLTLAEFEAAGALMDSIDQQILHLDDQLRSLRNQRVEARHNQWNLVKRVRAGARARHGDDHDILERFGLKRASERKSRRPKPPTD